MIAAFDPRYGKDWPLWGGACALAITLHLGLALGFVSNPPIRAEMTAVDLVFDRVPVVQIPARQSAESLTTEAGALRLGATGAEATSRRAAVGQGPSLRAGAASVAPPVSAPASVSATTALAATVATGATQPAVTAPESRSRAPATAPRAAPLSATVPRPVIAPPVAQAAAPAVVNPARGAMTEAVSPAAGAALPAARDPTASLPSPPSPPRPGLSANSAGAQVAPPTLSVPLAQAALVASPRPETGAIHATSSAVAPRLAPQQTPPQQTAPQSIAPHSTGMPQNLMQQTGAQPAQTPAVDPASATGPRLQPLPEIRPDPAGTAPAGGARAPPTGPQAEGSADVMQSGIAAPEATQPPPAPDDVTTFERVMAFLAGYRAPDCFMALPGLTETGGFRFDVFARDPVTIGGFRRALEAEVGLLPNTRMVPISEVQCRALDFLRDAPAYPAFRAFIALESHSLASGGQLKGRIGNSGSGVVGLYIVDDEGIVQDLSGFLGFSRRGAEFAIPMVLRGAPVETRQLLVAVVTPARSETVALDGGAPLQASAFFGQMSGEFRRRDFRADLAVAAFSVR